MYPRDDPRERDEPTCPVCGRFECKCDTEQAWAELEYYLAVNSTRQCVEEMQ